MVPSHLLIMSFLQINSEQKDPIASVLCLSKAQSSLTDKVKFW